MWKAKLNSVSGKAGNKNATDHLGRYEIRLKTKGKDGKEVKVLFQ
jgi:hypothetical protein